MEKLTERLDEMNREEINNYFNPLEREITERVAVIREKYVDITGDHKLALILNQFIYWTPRTGSERYKRWILEEFSREEGELECLEGGWVWKKTEELAEETMLFKSKATMMKYLNELIDMGFLQKRHNPDYKFDKTYQYRVNLKQVVFALWERKEGGVIELGQESLILTEKLLQSLKSPKFKNKTPRLKDSTPELEDSTAIPKITSKGTSKTEREDDEKKENIDDKLKNKYRIIFNKDLNNDFIDELIKKYSINKDLLLKALEYCKHNAQYPSYLNKLLADWSKNGIETPKQADKYLKNRSKNYAFNYDPNLNESKNKANKSSGKSKVEELEEKGWS
ncbi:MAG: DnaD domain protein [Candidatus Woesearchaeota archaeon]